MYWKQNKAFKLIISIFILILILNFNVLANSIYWNAQTFSSKSQPSIAYLNGIYVITSDSIYTSNDAKTWNSSFSPAINGNYNEVYVLNNQFIAVGENVQPIKSKDGKAWSPIRLHENISPKDIYTIGDIYFWNSSPTSFSYSRNLLTWDDIPIPAGEKITNIKFVNDKCFFSTTTENNIKINCWVVDKTLIPKLLDQSITSIDNISYLPENETYLNIILAGPNLTKRIYSFNSQDGVTWQKSDFSISGNTDYKLDNNNFETLNSNGKIFLRLGQETYVTSNGSFWSKANNYGNFKTLKYSGAYFYNINNSKDVFISKDGTGWNDFSLPNEINTLSSINIFDNILIVSHVDYNIDSKLYTTTIYSHVINSYDEDVPDIVNENTSYSDTLALSNQYINLEQPTASSKAASESKEKETKIENIDKSESQKTDNTSIVLKVGSENMKVLDTNDKEVDNIKLSVAPILQKDTALVPLRDIITYIDGILEWNNEAQIAKINFDNKIIEITVKPNRNEIKVDNKILEIPVEPKIINGHIMVPIRPMMESIDFEVTWKAETNEIVLFNNKYI